MHSISDGLIMSEDKMKKSVSVIGCGWLGLPLGVALQAEGYGVKGTTTTKEKLQTLIAMDFRAFFVRLPSEDKLPVPLFESPVIIINIPPGRRDRAIEKNYPKSIQQIVSAATTSANVERVVFVSSTSVYGAANNPECLEQDKAAPDTPSGRALLAAEEQVRDCGKPFIILRFAGLAGPGRHPGRFLAGRKNLPGGNHPVNYLHLEDAIDVLKQCCKSEKTNKIYNVVAPEHPTKNDFYAAMAQDIHLPPPLFDDSSTDNFKCVNGEKLIRETGFTYKYANPMTFRY